MIELSYDLKSFSEMTEKMPTLGHQIYVISIILNTKKNEVLFYMHNCAYTFTK